MVRKRYKKEIVVTENVVYQKELIKRSLSKGVNQT